MFYLLSTYILSQCCLLFSTMPPEIVGEKMQPEQLNDAVNVMLSLQVRLHYNNEILKCIKLKCMQLTVCLITKIKVFNVVLTNYNGL